MKKLLFLFTILLLTSCDTVVKEKDNPLKSTPIFQEKTVVSGMRYRIYYSIVGGGYGVALTVINETKDSLECEYYKLKMTPKQ